MVRVGVAALRIAVAEEVIARIYEVRGDDEDGLHLDGLESSRWRRIRCSVNFVMCCGVPWTSFHCQPRSAQLPSVQQQCGASRRSDSRTACSGVVELSARSMTGSISASLARTPAECIRRHCDGGLTHAPGHVRAEERGVWKGGGSTC